MRGAINTMASQNSISLDDGTSIKQTDNPSEEQQICAVVDDSDNLKNIEAPTPLVKMLSIQTGAFHLIKDPSDGEKYMALANWPSAIHQIKDPTLDMKRFAIAEWYGHGVPHIVPPSILTETPMDELLSLIQDENSILDCMRILNKKRKRTE
ncbi:MAG: hypothetical protein CMC99_07500 [Flavobacteriales bacterium]|nr:hypothetical protein [Flavobacteriales bacterium]